MSHLHFFPPLLEIGTPNIVDTLYLFNIYINLFVKRNEQNIATTIKKKVK